MVSTIHAYTTAIKDTLKKPQGRVKIALVAMARWPEGDGGPIYTNFTIEMNQLP